MIALAAAFMILVLTAVWGLRLLRGPTLHDRAMAAHAAALHLVLLVAAMAAWAGQPSWIDVALALCLGDLVVMAAAFRIFRLRSLHPSMASKSGESA